MKTSKILLYGLLSVSVMSLQSCLKDQEDVFSESSSKRASEFIEQVKQTLTNSENGWILDYYPEASQSYGGYTYTVNFDNQDNVSARFENYPDDGAISSLYSVKSDDGPVLTFDTYNDYLHIAATPSTSNYRGDEGDFEFVIDSIGEDKIKVHGKRTHNTMYFRKLNEAPADYINKVANIGDSWITSEADLTIGGQPYRFVVTDLSNRQLTIYDGNGTEVASTAYNFTDTGIALYQPINLSGVQVQYINYDDTNLTMSANGITSTKVYVDPSQATALIGGVGSDNNAGSQEFTIPHLDQYTFTSTSDWLTFTKDGDKLTISWTANPDEGKVRVGRVNVTNGDYSSSFTVSQMDENAILGTYRLQVLSGSTTGTWTATIGYENNNRSNLYLTIQDYDNNFPTLRIPILYSPANGAFFIQSGQQIGTFRTYIITTVFGFADGEYSTGVSTNFFDMMPISADEDGNIETTLNGELVYTDNGSYDGNLEDVGYPIETFYLYAFSGSVSQDNMAGWYDRILSSYMVKTGNATSAKQQNLTGPVRPQAAPRHLQKLTGNKLRRKANLFVPYRAQNITKFNK